ncbi:nuclear transport factor 2 family protein [Candidatus Acetothermia bacterium]|nr:nuclear transport factor 2 family protein [Candidatus Acetothermia bacterium]MCI2431021.1 nuclear transport factor 2 family protein [Candidatus Acetothermia bacterium]MCI2436917.1 nuclear transport factor 2 family protein [Candidatus Acetothermia bacterium]
MLRFRWGILLVLLLVTGLLSGCGGERQPSSASSPSPTQDAEEQKKADERAIKAVLTLLTQGFARLDVKLLEDLWAPDATIIENNISFSSWAQYREEHLKPELALYSNEDSEWVIANAYVQIEGSIAWGQFSTFYAFTRLTDNQRLLGEGRGTIILIKTPEGWKILHLHLS